MGRQSDTDALGREARARMAQAEKDSRRRFAPDAERTDGQDGSSPVRPRRYRLYDRIAGKVSLTAINVVIIATAALLVAALVYGIVTGSPGR